MQNYMWMVPASHSTWTPKRSNWRKRYSYRPTPIWRAASPDDLQRQVNAYIAWLMDAYGVDETTASDHAMSQRRDDTVGAIVERESDACKAEHIGDVTIRTVKSWAGGKHYGAAATNAWSGQRVNWFACPKGEGQTTYRVIVGGKIVDSFLTKARARDKAAQLAKAA